MMSSERGIHSRASDVGGARTRAGGCFRDSYPSELPMMIDLRSDTVTQPTPEMRRAMADADVGDDGYGEDPTVNRLEEKFASMLGKQEALFVPSGTMANQIAMCLLSRPGTNVVVGWRSHVVNHEMGASARNAMVQFVTV